MKSVFNTVLSYVDYFSACLNVLSKALKTVNVDWPSWPAGGSSDKDKVDA